ncbi:MAG: methyltransferase domain-containing protein [Gammaproteobacteria bacterium]
MKPSSQTDQPDSGVNVDALMEQIRAEIGQRSAPVQPVAGPAGSSTEPSSTPQLSAGEVMARVRAEVARQRAGNALPVAPIESGVTPGPGNVHDHPLPAWQPAAVRLPEQAQYVLNDFLRFNDADFIEVAYEKLLRRPADPEGLSGCLSALRSGALGKVEILGLIRFSEEGRRQGVHVNGLLLPYKLHRWRHVRVLGWFLGMGVAVWRLPRLAWRLQGMEASAAHEAQETGRLLGRIENAVERRFVDTDGAINSMRTELAQSMISRVEGLRVVSARIEALQATVESTGEALRASDRERASQHAAVNETLAAHEARHAEFAETLQGSTTELHRHIEAVSNALQASDAERASQRAEVKETLAAHEASRAEFAQALGASDAGRLREYREAANRLTVHDAALARLEEQTRSDHRALRAVLDRLTVFLDASARQARKGSDESDEEPSLQEQYASFEQTFRGEREQIKQRAAHYLGTLASAGIEPGDAGAVLDLGSGRGEWLEVLAEHGHHGRGVDSNRGMLRASEARGHDVVEADALDYLHAQPNGSFAAITSMHMVEHMPYPVVIQLIEEALRVLRPGGVLILETPNPENVLVGSCMFYMDPTHLHPIPPPLLQWTVQVRGFEQVEIERLSENRGSPDLLPVSAEVPGAEQINQMVAWFTAPPDYAVVARKPA